MGWIPCAPDRWSPKFELVKDGALLARTLWFVPGLGADVLLRARLVAAPGGADGAVGIAPKLQPVKLHFEAVET